jgi:secreted protein with Ig-like and vWFA domain
MNTSDNGRYEPDESVERTIRALAASNAPGGSGTNRLEDDEHGRIADLGRMLQASVEWEAGQNASPVQSAALRERLEAELSAMNAPSDVPDYPESKLVQPAGSLKEKENLRNPGIFQRWHALALVLVAMGSLAVVFYQADRPIARSARDSAVDFRGPDSETPSYRVDNPSSEMPGAPGMAGEGNYKSEDSQLAKDESGGDPGLPPGLRAAESESVTTFSATEEEKVYGNRPNGNDPAINSTDDRGEILQSSDADSADGSKEMMKFLGEQSPPPSSAGESYPLLNGIPGGSGGGLDSTAMLLQPSPGPANAPADNGIVPGSDEAEGKSGLPADGGGGGGGFGESGKGSGEALGRENRGEETEENGITSSHFHFQLGVLGDKSEAEKAIEQGGGGRGPEESGDRRERNSESPVGEFNEWAGESRKRDRDEESAEQYESLPENRFMKPVGYLALSTFSIDVDTASWSNIRRFLSSDQMPPRQAVRIEEMINAFSYQYPQPVDGRPFAVHVDVAQSPWSPGNKLVRIGLKGREIARDSRPPSNLVFLIDVSGSMADDNKLPLLKRSLLMLVDHLTENDRIAIVTYASDSRVQLEGVSGDQKDKIRAVINSLSAGGSTHGSAGIQAAYDLASEKFVAEGTNRVIIATDGDLNVGVTDDNELVSLIKSRAESGVFLSVLGFGTGNLKDAKLEKLADNGNGQYHYIDDLGQAHEVLVSEMSGTLVTIAKDVKLQIEFNPAEVAGYRLIGYENRVLRNENFSDDRVDAGDIGAGHTVTALYEIIPVGAGEAGDQPVVGMRYQQRSADAGEPASAGSDAELTDAAKSGEILTLSLRYKQPEDKESELLTVPVKGTSVPFEQASADFRFIAAVAGFGMKLRQSAYAGNWTWTDVENTAVGALGNDPQGQRSEMVDLVRKARRLLGR